MKASSIDSIARALNEGAGRPQDLADVAELRRLHGGRDA
jgi:hypothetical protein